MYFVIGDFGYAVLASIPLYLVFGVPLQNLNQIWNTRKAQQSITPNPYEFKVTEEK